MICSLSIVTTSLTTAMLAMPGGGQFEIPNLTIDAGGGASTGGAFALRGTVGQPDAGVMGGGAFHLVGGFWVDAGDITPRCVADVVGDGEVNAADLSALLQAWGPNPGHPADFSGNGVVGPEDLSTLLQAWGACP